MAVEQTKFPFQARHIEPSLVSSSDDEVGKPNQRLITLALEASSKASQIDLADIAVRLKNPPNYLEVWPGEHYKLLAALTLILNPKLIIEVGTGQGLSALVFKKFMSADAHLCTFDILQWRGNTLFNEADFADGRLQHCVDDLGKAAVFAGHSQLISNADLILVDACKDGHFEEQLISNLKTIIFKVRPIIVFDDIRLWNMLKTWRELNVAKLDLTSFGHWSGTGLVDWTA